MTMGNAPDPALLLDWFMQHRRNLPWRGPWGALRDPYRVWLSEIMLQQTQAAVVAERFTTFLERWPDVIALARADESEILDAWAGLGYYRRARNLHRAARIIADAWAGQFPPTVQELKTLPGVGEYTAAAIAAFAFGVRTIAVDGNVARVLARVFAVAVLPTGTPRVRALGTELAPASLPGEFAEALIELGALVCRPRRPRCGTCPWQNACVAFQTGRIDQFPVPTPQARQAVRYSAAFRLTNREGNVLLRRQSEPGPFRGMLVLPGTPWSSAPPSAAMIRDARPAASAWRSIEGRVEHGLSHLMLRVTVHEATTTREPAAGELWHLSDGRGVGLPAFTRKLLGHGRNPSLGTPEP